MSLKRDPDGTTDRQTVAATVAATDLNRHALNGIAIQRRWATSKDYIARK